MNAFYSHILKSTLLAFFTFHLGMHILYLAPPNPATHQYSDFIETYMGTFFTQNWHLFAPEPATSSLQISYRCNSLHDWQYPINDLLKSHKSFPFTAKGKQTYVLQNLAREIYNGKILKKNDDSIRELPILKQYLQDHCGKYALAEVQIKRIFTQDYSKRFLDSNSSNETYEFRMQQDGLVWN